MNSSSKTRTQRRMEKKQALILLVLVLVVSLASFTLGVIVGRRGAERDLAMKQQEAEKILVAPAPNRSEPAAAVTESTTEPATEATESETQLSFYEDLNKQSGGAPLGSGINLPPVEKKEPSVKPPIDLPEKPIVQKPLTPPAGETANVSQPAKQTAAIESNMPKTDSGGSYTLQVGSFSAAADAGRLKQKLLDKGYPAYVISADLGPKGTWYRVRLGPYADSAAATGMQQLVEKKEQLKGFVTRQ